MEKTSEQQSTRPLVSIITPVYNMEAFLAETLDSVLSSDYQNIEVILMDDGSKDRSREIARQYAAKDPRVKACSQPNAGACAARNHAIMLARGKYILPVDADDLISPTFISQAVTLLEQSPDLKVVCPQGEFFGERTGKWHLPAFSRHLLARRNMIPVTAVYRKTDWERVGGYCEEIIAREDWEFWISILKDGGDVVRTEETGLYYRVRSDGKRFADRKLKRHVVNVLNKRHADFFERELLGPLHYHRSWSRILNRINKLFKCKA